MVWGRTKDRDIKQWNCWKLSRCNKGYQETSYCWQKVKKCYCGTFTVILWFTDIWWRISGWNCQKGIQQGLYPFIFCCITAGFPICSISKAVYYFQSNAVYQAEKTGGGCGFIFGWWHWRRCSANFTRRLPEVNKIPWRKESPSNTANSDSILRRASHRWGLWSYMAGY